MRLVECNYHLDCRRVWAIARATWLSRDCTMWTIFRFNFMIYTKNLRALVESDELRDVNFSGFAFISELNVRGIFSADFLPFFRSSPGGKLFLFSWHGIFLFFSPLTRSHIHMQQYRLPGFIAFFTTRSIEFHIMLWNWNIKLGDQQRCHRAREGSGSFCFLLQTKQIFCVVFKETSIFSWKTSDVASHLAPSS